MPTTTLTKNTARRSAAPEAKAKAKAPQAKSPRRREADGMAVASFVLGLMGLLVFNLVLGPLALGLAGLALIRGTDRRGRAALGLALGTADLIVLAALATTDHTLSWSFGP
ncbi:hypothetical protein [Streptomyces hiroshimensis]|uniref:DUF4190 domain-containing protein n=1 Tax=Streptomyces hiroshimensis TaxID=66424 RepID=A0ABQ2YCU4_9ACTN|nr:hypothetical protein [Streptomyces hiroshimensis]GGX78052.1 hypothetical protein GCM10010324_24480 [Streptomyces hiroshimensis]